ncbi:MAG: RsmB/NOP family class I SAM-dependent RNA methyltransferase [Clostridia bacterium]|nr:RsmB/NOP family class I SAM-dependent RNA methyltransferase [Clostridia bacterium]
MSLPEIFKNRIKLILKEKYSLFESAFEQNAFRALRVNALKCDAEVLKKEFKLQDPTAFCENSYYLPESVLKPGNHPLHHAGAFYMQEPSATSVVEAIGIEEGDLVLDLCASPGGKSTQAAAKLNGKGFILSNEFVQSRVQPLVSNIERMGIVNAVVTSARPDVLCPQLPKMFDKVIVDAPCSGEGMFRKEAAALENWSVENVVACAQRQKKILDCAAECVKSGGKLVYSTCTYAFEENEGVIAYFLKNHPQFSLVKPCIDFGESAIAEFAPEVENIEYARRIFNFNGGEGHFVAVMQREGVSSVSEVDKNYSRDKKQNEIYKLFEEFWKEHFLGNVPENVVVAGDKVYISPVNLKLRGVQIVRSGVFAGTVRNGRFVPEHALFNNTSFVSERFIDLSLDDDGVYKFLHGEEIACDQALKGYIQVKLCGIPLGFGKASNGKLKNHYPKGLRIL